MAMLNDPAEKKRKTAASRQQSWTQDPEGVRRDILNVARQEFSEKGFSGARVNDIAARTATSKRMIYYYFGGKQALYVAVLEEGYQLIRTLEAAIDLDTPPPAEALAELTAQTFDYHAANPWFVRLVLVENIHHARHMRKSGKMAELNLTAIKALTRLYQRGVAAGVFRPGVEPLQLHLTISALSFYNVSNRYSILEVFRHDMAAAEAHAARRKVAIETVLRYVAI